MSNISFGIELFLQLCGFVFLAGVGWMKIDALEKDIVRLEREVIDSRTVASRLLVLETKLESMDDKLDQVIKNKELS